MAPTPSAGKSSHHNNTPSSKTNLRTPQSKHRLNFNSTKPSPNPSYSVADHPVEVIGRIRDYPDHKDKPCISVNPDGRSIRLKTETSYRDFTLDGVSSSEDQDLDSFYKNFVQSRINGVKLGDKCTIMMYGPTGSGKSHTMFGCAKQQQQGIVYKSLMDILGDEQHKVGFVQVTVLEIYNEEIYDLLSTSNTNAASAGGFSIAAAWSRPNASKVYIHI